MNPGETKVGMFLLELRSQRTLSPAAVMRGHVLIASNISGTSMLLVAPSASQ